MAEETDDDVVLMKDRHGHVIGLERLNDDPESPDELVVETARV